MTKKLHLVTDDEIIDNDAKLTFPLCAACADARNMQNCTHTNEERDLKGTWCTIEVYKALEMGYKIIDIDQVWHYKTWQKYDGINPDSAPFVTYINRFLKLKQEASGWPSWVKTEEHKQQYIDRYEQAEGIRLDPLKIEKNPALRNTAKLHLNSFWGKFGQRDNLTKTVYINQDEKTLRKAVDDQAVNIKSITFIGDEIAKIIFESKTEFVEDSRFASPVIAAYTTAQARLKLYSYIENLGERCFYMDTDSCIYLKKRNEPDLIQTGDFLGEMTDEIDGGEISEFVAGGPKAYCFWYTQNGQVKTQIKVRGMERGTVEPDEFKNVVLEFIKGNKETITVTNKSKIGRINHQVVSKPLEKNYRVVYDKRRILPGGKTVPYGFRFD